MLAINNKLASLDDFGLANWSVYSDETTPSPDVAWTWSDGQGTRSGRVIGQQDLIVLEAEGIGAASVSFKDRAVLIRDREADADVALITQWAADQVVPRILSHSGHFVVHAGAACSTDGYVALFVAPSGYGKSTLTGYLHQTGWTLLSDDATSLTLASGAAIVRPLYRRLKILPDTWSQLFGKNGLAPPSARRKISIDLGQPQDWGQNRLPAKAIFILAPPADAYGFVVRRVSPAEACVDLVRSSFALDPADRVQASRRFQHAAGIANVLPSFSLSYPRNFASLLEVQRLINHTLQSLEDPSA